MKPVTTIRRSGFALIATMIVCGAVFMHFFAYTEERIGFGSDYTVQVVLDDAGGLVVNSDVRSGGLPVGRVRDIGLRNGNAVALLELEPDYAPIYRNATVLIRDKTPVGEHYVELRRGDPAAGEMKRGDVLPIGRSLEAVAIDEVLSTFDPATRQNLRGLLRGLGDGLRGRGPDLNRLFEASGDIIREGGPTVQALRDERGHLAQFVRDFGRVMQTVGDRGSDVRFLARRSLIAARAVGHRDKELGRALEQLPPALRQVRGTASALSELSSVGTPVLTTLGSAFERLTPAVHELAPAARAGTATVQQLGQFARHGTPLMGDLERFSRRAAAVTPALDDFLDEYRPFISYLAPYAADVGSFFALNRAVGLPIGPGEVLRVAFVASEDSYAASTGEEREAYDALIQSGVLSASRELGQNPYPAPGTIGKLRPFSGMYPRVRADP